MRMTKSQARKLFIYRDGKLYHRKMKPGVKSMTKPAGYLKARDRCWFIVYKGIGYTRARVVWIYHHGSTKLQILRKDGNLDNDRIENLYKGTYSERIYNQRDKRSVKYRYLFLLQYKNGKESYRFQVMKGRSNEDRKVLITKTFPCDKFTMKEIFAYRDNWLKKHSPKRYDALKRTERRIKSC